MSPSGRCLLGLEADRRGVLKRSIVVALPIPATGRFLAVGPGPAVTAEYNYWVEGLTSSESSFWPRPRGEESEGRSLAGEVGRNPTCQAAAWRTPPQTSARGRTTPPRQLNPIVIAAFVDAFSLSSSSDQPKKIWPERFTRTSTHREKTYWQSGCPHPARLGVGDRQG